MRGLGGGGGGGVGGGGERNAGGHTGDEKTTKRWEADDRARDRLKIRRVGEDNQKRHWFMVSTSGQIVLSSTRFSGQKGCGVCQ